jgi:hypothetical protein
MPTTLTFDAAEGCTIVATSADCEIDTDTNIITVTNLFSDIYEGGKPIKLIIAAARNPIGAQEAGPWSVTTLRPYDG